MFTIAKVTDSWGRGRLLVVHDIPMEKFQQSLSLSVLVLCVQLPKYPWC